MINLFGLVWEVAGASQIKTVSFPKYSYGWGDGYIDSEMTNLNFKNGTTDANDIEKTFTIQMDPFIMNDCRLTRLVVPHFIGEHFGGLYNDGTAMLILIILSSAIFLAVNFIALVSEIDKFHYGTFGFVQAISDAPKDSKYRRTIMFVIFISFLAAVYVLFFDNDVCAWWIYTDECNEFNWETAPVIIMGWFNTAHILNTTLHASNTKLAHSPLASSIHIPGMHIWDNPKVIYELVQDGLMMYFAKGDLTILQERLGMEKTVVDKLVSALCSMEVHRDFYSGRIKISHPDTTRRRASKKDLGERPGAKFQKVAATVRIVVRMSLPASSNEEVEKGGDNRL